MRLPLALLLFGLGAPPARAQVPQAAAVPAKPAAAPVDSALMDKLRDHLFDYGEDVPGDDSPGRCVLRPRPEGESGEVLLGCLQVDWLEEKGPVAPAVMRFSIGDAVVVSETWTKGKDGLFTVDQWLFTVSSADKLKRVRHDVFRRAGSKGAPLPGGTFQVLDPADAAVQAAWKKAALRVLKTRNSVRA